MMLHITVIIISLIFCCVRCLAHREYVARNPNSFFYDASLGHESSDKPSARNAYGKAFSEAKNIYTRELCLEDSDGDGQTNGFEMGDECCFWTADPSCSVNVLTNDSLSMPGSPSSRSSRPPCDTNCSSADVSLRCACCGKVPCNPGGGGGGSGDDDDDDDDDDKIWWWGGAGVCVFFLLGGGCVWYFRKRQSVNVEEEEYSTLN